MPSTMGHWLLGRFYCFTAVNPDGTVLLLNLVFTLVSRIYFTLLLRAFSEQLGEALFVTVSSCSFPSGHYVRKVPRT